MLNRIETIKLIRDSVYGVTFMFDFGKKHIFSANWVMVAFLMTMHCAPVLAVEESKDVGSGETVNDLNISSDSSSDYIQLNVNSGGTAQNTTVGTDGLMNVEGTAEQTTVNAGGILDIKSGGTATDTTLNEGNLNVSGGASADTINASNGSVIQAVESGASVSGLEMDSSSNFYFSTNIELSSATLDGSDMGSISTNTATDLIINKGSNLEVDSGGTANNTTVNGGSIDIINGGTAADTTVNNGGVVNVTSGTANNITVTESGTINVDNSSSVTDVSLTGTDADNKAVININGGTATNTSMNDFSEMNINSGSAEQTTVGNNAVVNVSGGTATNTIVQNGGAINASGSGATVNDVTLEDGSKFNFSTDATVTDIKGSDGSDTGASIENNVASGFDVNAGSSLTANAGGTIENSNVNGGSATVENGGTITNTTFENGGMLVANQEGAQVGTGVVIDSNTGAGFNLSTSATVNDLTYGNQTISITENTASNFDILAGSTLNVDASGSASDINVNGGTLNVNSGGSSNNILVNSGKMNINAGSASGTVINNSAIVDASNGAALSNTNINSGGTLNLGTGVVADNLFVGNGGILNINQDANANTIDLGGTATINDGGNASDITINNSGNLNVLDGGNASLVEVNNGGTLETSSGATVDGLTANANSVLNLSDGTILKNSLVIDKDANAAGSTLDFGNLFGTGTLLNSLTLTNGVNEAFGNQLISQATTDTSLTLSNGNYLISDTGQDGAVQVSGWNNVTLAGATVRLESDVTLNGTEQNFIINNGATLDVSGTLGNVVNASINGNVVNNGNIDFTLTSDESVNDILNISGNLSGTEGSKIVMNMNAATNSSDKLVIGGQATGSNSIYFKTSSPALPSSNILFAEATGGQADAFSIWRVEGSPYLWDVLFENNKWYAYVTNGDQPSIVPEMAAYYGLIDNIFMQTTNLGANLRNSMTESSFRKAPCRVPSNLKYTNRICYSNRPVLSGWFAPIYNSAEVESPYKYTASVYGGDGGLDLLGDGNTKFGILASYRNGSFEFDGSGTNYLIESSAETAINSYVGGIYIRHDSDFLSLIAAAYAGQVDADISTDDGVNADTSGTISGATVDVNYIWQNINGFRIEPGVRISYTKLSIDGLTDNAGKSVEFGDSSRTEVEAGVRFAQRWDFRDAKAEIFFRPALVQNINDGEDFELITGRYFESLEDRTLTKLELGMSFDMIGNWSAAMSGAYMFGSDYSNVAANLSLQYNF